MTCACSCIYVWCTLTLCALLYVLVNIDVDECNTTGVCHTNGGCINTIGTFSCYCRPGYSGDGVSKCTGKQTFILVRLLHHMSCTSIVVWSSLGVGHELLDHHLFSILCSERVQHVRQHVFTFFWTSMALSSPSWV